MPTSSPHQISDIVELIRAADPQRVLDVGVGFGKYGVLVREYLELLDGRAVYGDWRRTVDGIEIFPRYLTGLHETIYDRVIEGDAVEILPRIGDNDYDLVLLIDILEHFTRDVGWAVLEECLRAGRNVIVGTPLGFFTQEGYDNPHEQHHSLWTRRDLETLGRPCLVLPEHHALVAFIGEDAGRVQARVMSYRRRIQRSFGFLVRPLRAVKRLLPFTGARRLPS